MLLPSRGPESEVFMRRLPTAVIRIAIATLLLSLPSAAEARAAFYALRSPQVAFNSSALQALLDERNGGIQADTDQLDAQIVSFTGISRNFTIELVRGNHLEFGIYDPNLAAPAPRHPVFTASSAAPATAVCSVVADSTLSIVEFDSLFNFVRVANVAWAGQLEFGFYVSGPGGTWYSQDGRNAGAPHALTYAASSSWIGALWECMEPGAFDPEAPDAFTGVVVSIEPSTCYAPSVRASRAFGTDCTPTAPSTWGALKAIYR